MVSCTEVEGERTEGMEKTEQRGKAGRIDAGQKKDAASVGSQDSKKNKRCTVQRKQQRWIQQVLWSNNERRNQRERREHLRMEQHIECGNKRKKYNKTQN